MGAGWEEGQRGRRRRGRRVSSRCGRREEGGWQGRRGVWRRREEGGGVHAGIGRREDGDADAGGGGWAPALAGEKEGARCGGGRAPGRRREEGARGAQLGFQASSEGRSGVLFSGKSR